MTGLELLLITAARTAEQSLRTYPGNPDIVVPQSTFVGPNENPLKMHTHFLIYKPQAGIANSVRPDGGGFPPPIGGYTPAQMHTAYGIPIGGTGVIVCVVAYHYPTALKDFNTFSAAFGLPQETSTVANRSGNSVFQVVYQGGGQPIIQTSWAQEAALDMEWAHAMAPNAKIVLLEAQSTSLDYLAAADDQAASIPNVKVVTNSWGGGEFTGENSYDSHFQHPGVVFTFSAGDTGGVVEYPSSSPFVIGVGGTSLTLNGSNQRSTETAWSGSGGGPSQIEPRPSFQSSISGIVGSWRGAPDIAGVGNPSTGVAVYDSLPSNGSSGWMVFGGTSVASPMIAGIIDTANTARGSSQAQNATIYSNLGSSNFFDVKSGHAGGNTAVSGWDFVTGVGTPVGIGGF